MSASGGFIFMLTSVSSLLNLDDNAESIIGLWGSFPCVVLYLRLSVQIEEVIYMFFFFLRMIFDENNQLPGRTGKNVSV